MNLKSFKLPVHVRSPKLIACEPNPIDAIWTDRPAVSMNSVSPHLLQYAGKNSLEKREELGRKLKNDHVEAAVLTAPDSIAWLLNIRGRDVDHTPLPLCLAIFASDASVKLFIDQRKVTPALVSHLGIGVSLHPSHAFGAALDELGLEHTRVLCDARKSPSWVWDRLTQAGAVVVEGDDPCSLPKACKKSR